VRTIILQMMISLDGFIAGPNDQMDWIDNDPVMGEAHFALAENADAALIGHTVYQGMAQFWPQAAANPDASNNEAEFGKLMNEMSKIVISTNEEELAWSNAEQLLVADDDDLRAKIEELKAQPGESEYLLLYGGARTAQTLIRLGLVDEFRLDVCPVALGAGKPLFTERTGLEFVSATPYESGAMTVVYRAVS
jgi:dihydrofolate reductase